MLQTFQNLYHTVLNLLQPAVFSQPVSEMYPCRSMTCIFNPSAAGFNIAAV
jgi:hypothetical protein